jgi:hypothetical protein
MQEVARIIITPVTEILIIDINLFIIWIKYSIKHKLFTGIKLPVNLLNNNPYNLAGLKQTHNYLFQYFFPLADI